MKENYDELLKKVYDLDDLNQANEEIRRGGIVVIPNSAQNIQQYITNLLKPYSDDCEPYEVARVSDVLSEYLEDKEYYDDIHEFCKKIYGGKIDGDRIVSTINYNSLFSEYKIISSYDADEMSNIILPLEVKMVVDKEGKLYSEIPEGLYEQNLECKVIYLEYIN
jgi:hypothetical protein